MRRDGLVPAWAIDRYIRWWNESQLADAVVAQLFEYEVLTDARHVPPAWLRDARAELSERRRRMDAMAPPPQFPTWEELGSEIARGQGLWLSSKARRRRATRHAETE